MCKGEPNAGRWPCVISGEGSNSGALSRGHPAAKARHQGFFSLPIWGISRQSRFIPILRAAHLRVDSRWVNAALFLCVTAPSGLRLAAWMSLS